MADESQTPDGAERSEEEAAAFAEHRAVPSEEAAEIAGSVEDAPLEAFEEAQSAAEPEGDEPVVAEPVVEEPAVVEETSVDAEEPAVVEEPVVAEAVAEEPAAAEVPAAKPVAEAPAVEEPVAQEDSVPEPVAAAAEPAATAEQPAAKEEAAVDEAASEEPSDEEDLEEDEEEPAPRVKPAVPGAHLEVDIVPEGVDPLGRDVVEDPYAIDEEDAATGEAEVEEEALPEPISTAAIDLAAGARYRATGKRKTAIARVTLRPGSGSYKINGRPLDEYFPRETLQRNIRQPLETVGYEERMDVVARLHGGGVSAQAGALRHGVSRALLEADPNLRGELKRRGFLTRDSRAKERKKAGLKKARKRPQFSKR
jgi:small subunit ribosomal protein S9